MISSVYIHIPFCKKICSYCDFAKCFYNEDIVLKYLESLDKEVVDLYKNDLIKTIYIGGGTPSSLSFNCLKKLFKIIKRFKLAKEYEFTFECNVNDINKELLSFLKLNKVNRLSIGVESFNKKVLTILDRTYPDIFKIKLAKEYFSNISCDLIYGVNNETISMLKKDLKTLVKLGIPHISIYSLILEEHTKLYINNYIEQDEDLNRDMYDYIRCYLKDKGYKQYEISNFSKDGYMSKHNLVYWNNEEYYGFGVSAGGYIGDIRYNNTKSISNYIKGVRKVYIENLSIKNKMEYEMILGLRKIEGVNKKRFKEKYKKEIKDVFNVSKLESNNLAYFIPSDKLFVSNSILCDFILL